MKRDYIYIQALFLLGPAQARHLGGQFFLHPHTSKYQNIFYFISKFHSPKFKNIFIFWIM